MSVKCAASINMGENVCGVLYILIRPKINKNELQAI